MDRNNSLKLFSLYISLSVSLMGCITSYQTKTEELVKSIPEGGGIANDRKIYFAKNARVVEEVRDSEPAQPALGREILEAGKSEVEGLVFYAYLLIPKWISDPEKKVASALGAFYCGIDGLSEVIARPENNIDNKKSAIAGFYAPLVTRASEINSVEDLLKNYDAGRAEALIRGLSAGHYIQRQAIRSGNEIYLVAYPEPLFDKIAKSASVAIDPNRLVWKQIGNLKPREIEKAVLLVRHFPAPEMLSEQKNQPAKLKAWQPDLPYPGWLANARVVFAAIGDGTLELQRVLRISSALGAPSTGPLLPPECARTPSPKP